MPGRHALGCLSDVPDQFVVFECVVSPLQPSPSSPRIDGWVGAQEESGILKRSVVSCKAKSLSAIRWQVSAGFPDMDREIR